MLAPIGEERTLWGQVPHKSSALHGSAAVLTSDTQTRCGSVTYSVTVMALVPSASGPRLARERLHPRSAVLSTAHLTLPRIGSNLLVLLLTQRIPQAHTGIVCDTT